MTIGLKIGTQILRNEGRFPGDPQCDTIWLYTNKKSYELLMAIYHHPYNLVETEFVGSPVLLWSRDKGYTTHGIIFLNNSKEEEEEE